MQRLFLLGLLAVLIVTPAQAGPMSFQLDLAVPPVIANSKAPEACTITYLVEDLRNNDLFAQRMRIAPKDSDTPVGNKMPCPVSPPPRLAQSALDSCLARAGQAKYCVFADMGRGFSHRPNIDFSDSTASRCSSDKASTIGVACLMSGKLSVCNVGCGNSPQAAVTAAQARCQAKHQHPCPITGSVPVAGP